MPKTTAMPMNATTDPKKFSALYKIGNDDPSLPVSLSNPNKSIVEEYLQSPITNKRNETLHRR